MASIATNDFMFSKYSIAVILPAYNEVQTIKESIGEFRESLPEACIHAFVW